MIRQAWMFAAAVLLAGFCPRPAFPGQGAAAEFLIMGTDARSAALGGGCTALVDDASALSWNPAALARLKNKSAVLSHMVSPEGGVLDYGAYGQAWGGGNGWGLSVLSASAGELSVLDPSGGSSGSLTPRDTAFSLGFARSWGGFSAGVSGKTVRSTLSETAQTFAADAGVLVSLAGGRLSLAAAVSNVGGRLKFDQEAEALPMGVRVGSAYRVAERWTMALEEVFPRDGMPFTAAGIELSLLTGGAWGFLCRAGFNTQRMDAPGSAPGLSFGFRVSFQRMGLDYSATPMETEGGSQRVSLSYRF